MKEKKGTALLQFLLGFDGQIPFSGTGKPRSLSKASILASRPLNCLNASAGSTEFLGANKYFTIFAAKALS